MKNAKSQRSTQRAPRQQRAQEKVELILEAAMRLLAKGGLAALTTNAVAETAGVSIGTLYQYFGNKDAILDALADREMSRLSQNVLDALKTPGTIAAEERLARVIRAVTSSYGGRRQVHRIVMEYSLARGGKRLAPLIAQLVELLAVQGRYDDKGRALPTSRAEAFVMTNAFAGVMRAMIIDGSSPPQDQIEKALVKLIINFTGR